MHNIVVLGFQVSVVCSLLLIALRLGKEVTIAWLGLLAVVMNLFVLKQITLFKLEVTASDALAVGYLLGLNLMQEFYGESQARSVIWISLFLTFGFWLLTVLHLAYIPNIFDQSQTAFQFLFSPMPRLLFASVSSFLVVQLLDIAFFRYLREKTGGRFLPLRTTISLLLSQVIDTLLFTFLGLYGLIAHPGDVILMSLCIKGLVILATTPFVVLCKRGVTREV
ncbi:MAG: hypothetical protein K940chlam9_00772 [Chlamydiae bacterium]|nr:hypothetical protein [Chlamydiota bacterium]